MVVCRWCHVVASIVYHICLFGVIFSGLFLSGNFTLKEGIAQDIEDRVAIALGFSAQNVQIVGLERHKPEEVLDAMGVRLGGSLLWFDASRARRVLEGLDWVSRGKVQRIYPNQLEIFVEERKPLAIWQREGRYYIIDQAGDVISTLEKDPEGRAQKRLLVTGEGANLLAFELVEALEAYPKVKEKVLAAAWVGRRRWTLYLASGQKVFLPEKGVRSALGRYERLEAAGDLSSKAVLTIDLRLEGRAFLRLISPLSPPETAPTRYGPR